MIPWFIWKGKNSDSEGLWISKLPKIIIPAKRVKNVTIPGRAGDLTLEDGEDVYDPYKKEITIQCINDVLTPSLLDWLRGDSDLIISNEINFAYQARIAGQVEFSRLGNDLRQAVIPFVVQPFKKARDESQYRMSISSSSSVLNRGQIKARPKMMLTGTGALTISCGDTQMVFSHRPPSLIVDCDAEIMTTTATEYNSSAYYYKGDYATWDGGLYRFLTEGIGSTTEWEYIGAAPSVFEYLWPGEWSGKYLQIPVGESTIGITGTASITIDPRWRWL